MNAFKTMWTSSTGLTGKPMTRMTYASMAM